MGFVGLIISGISFVPMAEVQGVKHGKGERFMQLWDGSLSLSDFLGWGCAGEVGAAGALASTCRTSSEAPVLRSPLLLRAVLVSHQQPHGLGPTVLPLAADSVTTVTD